MAERHRCQIDLMIDEMVAAGKSEQDILAAIVAQYRPYDSLPAEFQCLPDERHPYDDAPVGKTPSLPVSARSTAQAYDRGANAAVWLSHARQRMKRPAK